MKKLSRLLATLVAMVLTLTMVSASALTTEETSSSTISDTLPLTEEEMEKESVANDKYNVLLEAWACEDGTVSDIRGDFPDFYGGAYINDNKELVIQVTVFDNAIVSYFDELIDLTDVVFEEVEYSFAELMQVHDEMAELMNPDSDDEFIANITGVGLSIQDNSVNLYLNTSSESMANLVSDNVSLTEAIQDKLSEFSNIVVKETNGPDLDCTSVEPGTTIKFTGHSQSVGFWAYDSSGNLGIITASHGDLCTGETVYYGGNEFGTVTQDVCSGTVDAAFVKMTKSGFTVTNYISGWGVTLSGRKVTSFNAAGTTVYMKGKTSGCQSGKTVDICVTTVNNISDCVLTDVTCNGGDSGGIVYIIKDNDYIVAGIVKSRRNAADASSPGDMIFVKAQNIVDVMGITLYH